MKLPDVHVVFGDSAAGTLKSALRDLGVEAYREKVIVFSDIFSIGPVWRLHEKRGLENRLEWLNTRLTHEPADDFANWYMNAYRQALHKLNAIDDHAEIAIWIGDNAHDQTGLRLVLHLLRGRNNKFVLANATKAYRERFARFDPLHMGEIVHDKMIELFKDDRLFQPLSDHDRVRLEQAWAPLSDSETVLRIWRDGDIQSVPAGYFDERLIEAARMLHSKQEKMDFMKAARLIGEVLGSLDQYVEDEYLEYRLRCLIQDGVFRMEGSLEAMRTYSVKLNDRLL